MKKIYLPALLLLTSTAIAQEIPSTLPVPSVEQFKKVCTAEKIKKHMIEELAILKEQQTLEVSFEGLAGNEGPAVNFRQVTKALEEYRSDLEKNLVVDLSVVSVMPTPVSFYVFEEGEKKIPVLQAKYKLSKDEALELTSGFYPSEKFGCLAEADGGGLLIDENGVMRDPVEVFTNTTVGANNSSRSGQEKPEGTSGTRHVAPGSTGR